MANGEGGCVYDNILASNPQTEARKLFLSPQGRKLATRVATEKTTRAMEGRKKAARRSVEATPHPPPVVDETLTWRQFTSVILAS